MKQDLIDVLERLSQIADSAQRKVIYLLVAGVIASAYLAWLVYHPESAVWWNVIKCGLIMLPSLVWAFIWNVMDSLKQAPQLVSNLALDEQGVLSNLQNISFTQKDGLRSLFSTVKTFKQQDGLDVVLDTVGGVTLLVNPLFMVVSFLCMALLLLFMIIAPLLWLFL